MLQAQQILHDRYQLIQLLGQVLGRQTWRAIDLHHTPPIPVIVKLLAFAQQTNWEPIKLFEREAKVLQHLHHPRIPHYHDFFSIEDHTLWFVIVQQYIPGTSLKDLLTQGKRFSHQQICQIATEVLEILIYLHELKPPVFHRDIKPSNLIWGEDQHIYLIDFGAVQDKAAVEGATFTIVGTYGYAPIEQFGGRTVPSSDLYALGATLIHLVTGVSPAQLPQKQFRIHFSDKIMLYSNWVRWLEKLTEPDMGRRFSSARDALASFEMVQQASEHSLTVVPQQQHSQSGAINSPVRWKILVLLIGSTVGLASLGGMITPSTPPTSLVDEKEISQNPEQSQTCWNRYSPEQARQRWRGRAPVGQIEIVNDSDQLVTVTLFHPDSDGRSFATWDISPGQSTFLILDNQRINIGADWGIRVASSCIMPVGDAGQYSKGRYQVRSSFLFN